MDRLNSFDKIIIKKINGKVIIIKK